jgi:predicted nucleotidyltransferase
MTNFKGENMRNDSFKALVGSHNYNLNTPESDKDYKVFFYPSFDDLYAGEKYSKAKTSETEDIEYHDIRKLPDMLWKSNVNFVEVLFSVDVKTYDNLYKTLHSKREEIARMNLPYLYDACMGMFFKKKKEFQRDKESDQKKAFKHAMSALRILDFLDRYEKTNFSSFENSIKYSKLDNAYYFLMDIRNGKYTIEQLENQFSLAEENTNYLLKDIYKKSNEDLETKEWLYKVVKWEVEEKIFTELQ